MMDKNRKSKGCGCARFETREEAERAVEVCHNQFIEERCVFVEMDRYY